MSSFIIFIIIPMIELLIDTAYEFNRNYLEIIGPEK